VSRDDGSGRLGFAAPPPPRGRVVLLLVGLVALVRGRPHRRTGEAAGPAPEAPTRRQPAERPLTVSGVEEPPRWRSRYAFYGVGAAMIAWGLRGLFTTPSTKPLNWAMFFVGGVVAHDLVYAPIFAVVVFLVVRRIPAPYRPYVQAGVVITGLLTLVALPMVLSLGGVPDDPSALPLPYARNLMISLGTIWAAVVLTAVMDRRWRAAGRHRQARTVIE